MKKLYSSRKTNLFGIVTLLFLTSGFSVSAQQIITEHNSNTLNGNIKYQPNFDETNYTKVLDENGDKVFLKNQSPIENTPEAESTETDVSLNINFVYDESQFYISSVMIYDESGYMHAADYYSVTNPFAISVPDGTYDILTEFKPLNAGKSHFIIKEQQSVQGNTTVQMNSAAAINYITTTGYDENGETFQLGAGSSIYFNRMFYFNPMDFVTGADFYFSYPEPGQDPEWNFYINDVTDRYSIIQTLIGAGSEEGDYFTKFETINGITESISISNNPANWSYHTEAFQPTQLSYNEIAPAHFTASTFNENLLIGWATSAGGVINQGDETFRGFLNNPLDGDPADLFVVPAVIDHYVSFSPTTGGVQYFTKGSPVFSDGNGGVLYGSGDVSFNYHSDPLYSTKPFLGDDYYVLDNNDIMLLPSHPRFTFDNATTPSVILGDNVPITVTGFQANTFKIADKGRYGETRETDYLATQLEVKQNGDVVFSGTYEDFNYSTLPSSGQVEIVLTNTNSSVETLAGINTTKITYNADRTDAPPTLQHLQFRNIDNQVTPIFDSPEGATVRLTAGDFNYTMIDEASGYYAYEEGNSVAISYSVHNQNDWTELGLTEYPEYFQMPAFGDYYEASLADIVNENVGTWYDLKVICTDAGGNMQEQVISPAFKINNVTSTLSIENIDESNFFVYPNPFSNQVNVTLPVNVKGDYTFKVIDFTGRIVYTNYQSDKSFHWDGSDLSKGIYILSIENDGMAVAKKVIKL